MNELMLREKSVCTARLPMFGTRTAVALPRIDDRLYLAAGTSDGYLFIYALETGGNECALVRQFRIGPKYGDDASIPLGTTSARGAMLVDVEVCARLRASLHVFVALGDERSRFHGDGDDTSRRCARRRRCADCWQIAERRLDWIHAA